jgi:two-component system, NarL family, nitrate/nitrite response regulator NarL
VAYGSPYWFSRPRRDAASTTPGKSEARAGPALSAGAAAYMGKDTAAADALRAVAAGEVVLTPRAMTSLGREIRLRQRSDRPWLTRRERQILVLVAEDSTTPQIAAALHLSVATVKSHMRGAYQKLGVSDRASAVAVAMRLGLIE